MTFPSKKPNEIDLTLTILCCLAERGDTLNNYEIAELCGCNHSLIQQTVANALSKLRGWKGRKLYEYYL